jgi:ubiquinone/menaquinone biosynthesis C-methylase UbiE
VETSILVNPKNKLPLGASGKGLYDEKGNLFPLNNGVYRFAESSGYTENFGFQWKEFKRTQLDKFNGTNFSKNRFFQVTNWNKENLDGENILEVGCGAGRFSQIVLDYTSANLYSLDYSEAVDANFENNGPHNRLTLFQASVYEMPFAENSFDKVFCFGVLQHTPDVKKTIECLYKVLKPNGELIVDFYPYNGFWTKIHAKYILRPWLKKLSSDKLLSLIKKNIGWIFSLATFFNKMKIGKLTNRFLPICDFSATHPKNLTKEEQKEWVTLDTFDMFSPSYDQPQKKATVAKYFHELKMKSVVCRTITYDNNLKITFAKGIK